MKIKEAPRILGSGFIRHEPLAELFGVSPGWLTSSHSLPFAEDILLARKDTHIVLPILPVRLWDLVEHKGINRASLYYGGKWWYESRSMADLMGSTLAERWISFRLQPIEYMPAIGMDDHWTPQGDKVMEIHEAIYVTWMLQYLGITLRGAGEEHVLLSRSRTTIRQFFLWRLCGKYVLNSFDGTFGPKTFLLTETR